MVDLCLNIALLLAGPLAKVWEVDLLKSDSRDYRANNQQRLKRQATQMTTNSKKVDKTGLHMLNQLQVDKADSCLPSWPSYISQGKHKTTSGSSSLRRLYLYAYPQP